jgi:hypothetical protein
LPPTANASFQPSTNTFIVRPAQQFVSASDPDYLETRYPDLLPFGQAGFSVERKISISKKVLIAYFTNLSTMQFQQPDFVLPVSDMIVRNSSYNMTLVHANFPSREINAEGNVIPRAEAFSQIPLEDLKKLADYQSGKNQTAIFREERTVPARQFEWSRFLILYRPKNCK